VEAQIWLASLTIYCSKEQRTKIQEISTKLNGYISMFMGFHVGFAQTTEEDGGARIKPSAMGTLGDLVEMTSVAYFYL
jgi:hypothetical protein